jgi:hypothetical protein
MALPWSFVSKNTNSKHQIPNKSQIPMTKTLQDKTVWILEFWVFQLTLVHFRH